MPSFPNQNTGPMKPNVKNKQTNSDPLPDQREAIETLKLPSCVWAAEKAAEEVVRHCRENFGDDKNWDGYKPPIRTAFMAGASFVAYQLHKVARHGNTPMAFALVMYSREINEWIAREQKNKQRRKNK
jgi:hypothetical protein